MPESLLILPYEIDGARFGLPIAEVEQVLAAVEIQPLADAPPGALGVINVRGEIVPVISVRGRLGLGERPLRLSDRMVLLRIAGRLSALLVDAVGDVHPATLESLSNAAANAGLLGVIIEADGIRQVHSSDFFAGLSGGDARRNMMGNVH